MHPAMQPQAGAQDSMFSTRALYKVSCKDIVVPQAGSAEEVQRE